MFNTFYNLSFKAKLSCFETNFVLCCTALLFEFMLADSHCHLTLYSDEERDRLVSDALKTAVTHILTVCTKMSEVREIISVCNKYSNVYGSVGVHPSYVPDNIVKSEFIIQQTQNEKIIAIGETGLDYYKNNIPSEHQIISFIEHIYAAQETSLPLIIHARNADNEMCDILKSEYTKKPFTAVMHCFNSSRKLLDLALELGFYISFSGIITFKDTEIINAMASEVPLDRLLIETDAPFLAPVPKRGKRNEPSFIVHTFNHLKKMRKDSELLAESMMNNFFTLFNKI